MELKFIFIVTVMLYGHSVTAQLPDIIRCHLGNSTCEKEAIVSLAKILVINEGLPQFGIPSLNPIEIINEVVYFLNNILKITLNRGNCTGFTTCRFLNYGTNVTSYLRTAEIICGRLETKGTYTIETNPIFIPIIGNITGNGNVNIVAEDYYYEFISPFKLLTNSTDGRIYLKPDFKAGSIVLKVLKSLSVTFDKILVNGRNITKKIVSFLNKYWRIVLETIGKPFHDVNVKYYIDAYEKFYAGVPADYIFIDDLTPYLSKDTNECSSYVFIDECSSSP